MSRGIKNLHENTAAIFATANGGILHYTYKKLRLPFKTKDESGKKIRTDASIGMGGGKMIFSPVSLHSIIS